MDSSDRRDHHFITHRCHSLRKSLGLAALVSAILLVWLYIWDHLTRRTDRAVHWCIDRFGYPAQFDYLLPDRAERIGADIVERWGPYPPGATCTFSDMVTNETVTVGPEPWRGYAAIVLVVCIVVFGVGYLVLRRRGRSARQKA